MKFFAKSLSAIVVAMIGVAAHATPLYSVEALGTLGGRYTVATGINNSGQVTGDSGTPLGEGRAFVYSNGVMTDLGTLSGDSSIGYAINNAGQVTGMSNRVAFVSSNGVMSEVANAGEFGSFAVGRDINDSGQVTGYISAGGSERAFIRTNDVVTILGTLGGDSSLGYGINSSGQVTGGAQLANGQARAFITINGVMTNLGTLGGDYSLGMGINDSGQVTGAASLTMGGLPHAFVSTNGVMSDLGSFAGGYSYGTAINNSGQVVGASFTEGWQQRAFVTINGVMTDLNSLVTLEDGIALTDAVGINDAGQIVANANGRAYLLTPVTAVPEPESYAMMLVGLGVVCASVRRRKQRARV